MICNACRRLGQEVKPGLLERDHGQYTIDERTDLGAMVQMGVSAGNNQSLSEC